MILEIEKKNDQQVHITQSRGSAPSTSFLDDASLHDGSVKSVDDHQLPQLKFHDRNRHAQWHFMRKITDHADSI